MTVLNLFGKHQARLTGHRTLPSWRSVVRGYPQLTISPAILVAILTAWWVASHVLQAPTYIVPSPEQVWRALVNGLARAPWDPGGYWYHAGITVWEALLGFAI